IYSIITGKIRCRAKRWALWLIQEVAAAYLEWGNLGNVATRCCFIFPFSFSWAPLMVPAGGDWDGAARLDFRVGSGLGWLRHVDGRARPSLQRRRRPSLQPGRLRPCP